MTQHQVYTLSSTEATRLTPPGLHSGMDITLQNVDESAYVFVGGVGVTSENFGYRISPNNGLAFELASPDALYAISDVAGTKLAVIKVGLEG